MTASFFSGATSPLEPIGAGLFGLIWGSFFNVVISRLPADESVVFGRSHCPKCQDPIPWYLNIPLLSYAWLRGKCRHCKNPISVQYPLVELVTGLMFAGLAAHYGLGARFAAYSVFLSLLLCISVIDFHHQIIPDELSLSGIVVGFLAVFLTHDVTWLDSLLGILVGGGTFWLIAAGYEKMSGREGLGGGDIKLLGMIGAWLGVQSILLVVIVSSGVGSVIGLGLMALKGRDFKTAIPFGPFLALAAVICLFWGPQLNELLIPKMP